MRSRRRPVAEKIFKTLKDDIFNGKYRSNTYLPSENQLCEVFDASRGTVRSVLSDLEQAGLIRINPGKGSCVTVSKRSVVQKRFITGMDIDDAHIAAEFMQILTGVCKSAAKHNAEAIIAFDAIRDPKEIIERYISGTIDGVIYIECKDYSRKIAPLEKAGIPCVVANLEDDMNCVSTSVDFRQVGRLAAHHLLKHGHKNSALLMGRSFFYQEMAAGFKGAFAEENIFIQNENIFLADTEDETLSASKNILKKADKFSAVFTGRDYKASIFYQACRESEVNIPVRMSIISYDDITWNESDIAGLTTVSEPAEEMGKVAVDLLLEWIAEHKKPNSIILPGQLIKNKSVKTIT